MYFQRIVSLWDMLVKLDDQLLVAIANIEQCRVKILDLVHKGTHPSNLNISLMRTFRDSVAFLGHACTQINVPGCKRLIDACQISFEYLVLKDNQLSGSINDINGLNLATSNLLSAFISHAQDNRLFFLRSQYAQYLDGDLEPFGCEVSDTFPLSSDDISESAKCLALERWTAAVFHLMRAMESTVQRLASCIGVVNVDREWGKLLSDISKKIEEMPKSGRRNQWSQSHAHLYHVKQAWRNDTMHPKATYTEEQASEVFTAVGSFMRHLAPLVQDQLERS